MARKRVLISFSMALAAIAAAILIGLIGGQVVPLPSRVEASGDGFTLTAQPSAWTGNSAELLAGGYAGGAAITFLRFDVHLPPNRHPERAWLWLARAQTALPEFIELSRVPDTSWVEGNLTAADAPQLGTVVNSLSPDPAAKAVAFDVTKVIQAPGTYSFAVTVPSGTEFASFVSKEGGSVKPTITLEWAVASPSGSASPSASPAPSVAPWPTVCPTVAGARPSSSDSPRATVAPSPPGWPSVPASSAQPPVAQPPVVQPPVVQPPVAQPPVAQPPAAQPSSAEAPIAQASSDQAGAGQEALAPAPPPPPPPPASSGSAPSGQAPPGQTSAGQPPWDQDYEGSAGEGSAGEGSAGQATGQAPGVPEACLSATASISATPSRSASATPSASASVFPSPSVRPSAPKPPAFKCEARDLLVPTCGALWGVAPAAHTAIDRLQALHTFDGLADKPQMIFHAYHRGHELFPTPTEIAIAHDAVAPRVLFLNWKPTGATWAQIAAGDPATDFYLDELAQHMRANLTDPFFFTVHHEPENDVVEQEGSGMMATDYAAAFRHVVQRLRADGVDNLISTMCFMAYVQWNVQPWFGQLYPGDDVVDWVSWDIYAYSEPGYGYGDFAEMLNRRSGSGPGWPGFYNWAAKTFPDKPLMVAEWGVWYSQDNPGHIAAFFDSARLQLELFPRIKAYVYFESPAADGRDSRIQLTPDGLQAFQRLSHHPAFDVVLSTRGTEATSPRGEHASPTP